MAEYTVTCQSCGALRLGNSKWIPLSAVKKAGADCRSCGSNQTEITAGWPTDKPKTKKRIPWPLFVVATVIAHAPTALNAQVISRFENIEPGSVDGFYGLTQVLVDKKNGEQLVRIPQLLNCRNGTFAYYNHKSGQISILPINDRLERFCIRAWGFPGS